VSFDLILSDIHLKVGAKDVNHRREFTEFLLSWKTNPPRRIICLGDIFDFWFEYKHVIFSGYFEVLNAFYELNQRGVELFFIGGNHDFWAGKSLEQIGFHILESGVIIDFDGCRTMLIHGDGLNKKDWGYRFFKTLARNQFVIFIFRLIHPDWAMGIAQWLSKGSRKLQKDRVIHHHREVEAIKSYAVKKLTEGICDAVITGHCHKPECSLIQINNRQCWYINSGDWLENKTYVKWDGEKFHLCGKGEISETNLTE